MSTAPPVVLSAVTASSPSVPAWGSLVLSLVAGLVLFLFGVEQLSTAFASVGDERIRRLVERSTHSVLTGVLTGTVVCAVLDSSSATIILAIAMVRGGLLTFEQSMGLVLGANIGTTLGAQIIALDVFGYAPILLATGFLLRLLAPNDRLGTVGLGLFGAGLLFFGLGYIEDAVHPLRQYEPFLDWVSSLGQRPLLGAFAGALATVVLQSSSATVGMAIVLAKSGIFSVPAGVALMLGAEIGTVSNTLVASLGRGREALRCALFHFIFNATTVVAGLLLIGPLIQAAEALAPGSDGGHVARSIANAQVIFNVVGVALFIPLVPTLSKWLFRLLPASPAHPPTEVAAEP